MLLRAGKTPEPGVIRHLDKPIGSYVLRPAIARENRLIADQRRDMPQPLCGMIQHLRTGTGAERTQRIRGQSRQPEPCRKVPAGNVFAKGHQMVFVITRNRAPIWCDRNETVEKRAISPSLGPGQHRRAPSSNRNCAIGLSAPFRRGRAKRPRAKSRHPVPPRRALTSILGAVPRTRGSSRDAISDVAVRWAEPDPHAHRVRSWRSHLRWLARHRAPNRASEQQLPAAPAPRARRPPRVARPAPRATRNKVSEVSAHRLPTQAGPKAASPGVSPHTLAGQSPRENRSEREARPQNHLNPA